MEGNLVPGEADKISDTLTNLRIEMVERLSKIETKLDRVEDHENRIRKLERMIWVAAGAGAVAGNADRLLSLIGP